MTKVRYIGLTGIRVFDAGDFAAVGVTGQESVRFRGRNLNDPIKHGFNEPWEDGIEVSEEAALYLVEKEGEVIEGDFRPDFEFVDEADAPEVTYTDGGGDDEGGEDESDDDDAEPSGFGSLS